MKKWLLLFIAAQVTLSLYLFNIILLSFQNSLLPRKFLFNAQKGDLNDALNEYVKLHEDIVDGRRPVRLIFSLFYGGYGNQINSVISAMLIGVLHERAVLIKWDNIDQFMQQTLKNMFLIRKYRNSLFNPEYKKEEIDRSRFHVAWQFTKKLNNITDDTLLPNLPRIRYDDNSAYFMEICASDTFWDRLEHYSLVSKETLTEARLAINNISLTEDQRQEFTLKVGFEVGGRLLNRFWKPNEKLQREIDSLFNEFYRGNIVIGMHIRLSFIEKEKDIPKFINCALKIEKHIAARVMWFIASDSQETLDELKATYPDKVVTTNGTIKNIDPAINKNDFSEGLRRTILDSELLSLCNYLIITGGSTFGFVPAMKTGRLPYYINGRTDQQECEIMSFFKPPHNQYAAIF